MLFTDVKEPHVDVATAEEAFRSSPVQSSSAVKRLVTVGFCDIHSMLASPPQTRVYQPSPAQPSPAQPSTAQHSTAQPSPALKFPATAVDVHSQATYASAVMLQAVASHAPATCKLCCISYPAPLLNCSTALH